jgi:hypothetical protein
MESVGEIKMKKKMVARSSLIETQHEAFSNLHKEEREIGSYFLFF